MNKAIPTGLPLLMAAVLMAGVWSSAPSSAAPIIDDPGDRPELPECISDANISISASPATIMLGESTAIRWSVQLPPRCSGVQVRFNQRSVALTGAQTFKPPRHSTYTIIVSHTRLGVYTETSRSAQVAVNYEPTVVIDASTEFPKAVLLGALASGNEHQTIELCNVDIDLTGHTHVEIGSNRQLIASPACARGPRNKTPPRIFVTDRRSRAPLFLVYGDNVRISGFRLEGPTSFNAQGDITEKGIVIAPSASAEPIRNIEISNMEVFHWAGLGVQVLDNTGLAERGRLFNTNPDAVRVKGSSFHHNRHGEEGYGVESSAGAYLTIERNVFDENRHAIAGGSKNSNGLDYSGYTVRDNLILPHGGQHCSGGWWNALLGWQYNCRQTHQIDMHGDQNEELLGFGDGNWLCGRAGETMLIERNTILYTAGAAIKIRGNPFDKAVVDSNVFSHGDSGSAIKQTGTCGLTGGGIFNPIDVRPN
ncbi:MAG TPA: hypothetical protein VIT67_21870, partial [Povalibacter sp.]